MLKKIKNIVAGLVVAMAGVVPLMAAQPTLAVSCPGGSARGWANTLSECSIPESESGDTLIPTLQVIINVVLGVLGLIAVIMIIIGGFSFMTSQGDASKVTKARNTILYGVIGLIIAMLAFAIVNFVLTNVFK